MTTVLVLHPFPFDSRVFEGLRTQLADQQLLTPDLHGDGDPDLDVLADQAIAAVDAAGVDTAVVGGVSMGGYVALNLLARYPQRITGIILIDTKATADAETALTNRAAMAARADRGIRPDAVELLTGMLSPRTARARPELVATLTAIIDAQPAAEIGWLQRAMAARPDRTDALSAVEIPVLVIVGTDDTITPPAGAAAMAASTRRSTLHEIPHAGHLAVAEDPTAVAAAISSWLAAT